jgi:hypothetical protein
MQGWVALHRRKVLRIRGFHEILSTIERRHYRLLRVSHYTSILFFAIPSTIARHGGWSHEVPPPEQVVTTSPGAPPKSCHIALQARINSNNMAQGEGSAAVSGAVGHTRKEEHGGDTAESYTNILCTASAMSES